MLRFSAFIKKGIDIFHLDGNISGLKTRPYDENDNSKDLLHRNSGEYFYETLINQMVYKIYVFSTPKILHLQEAYLNKPIQL